MLAVVVKLQLIHHRKSICFRTRKIFLYTFLSLRMRNVNVSKFRAQNIPLLLCSRVKFILHYLKKKFLLFHISILIQVYIYIHNIRTYFGVILLITYTRNINLYTMYNVFRVQAIHLKKGSSYGFPWGTRPNILCT